MRQINITMTAAEYNAAVRMMQAACEQTAVEVACFQARCESTRRNTEVNRQKYAENLQLLEIRQAALKKFISSET